MCDVGFNPVVDAQVRHNIGEFSNLEGVLAVDPGGTTGLAWVTRGKVCVAEVKGVGGMTWMDGVAVNVHRLLVLTRATILVLERFDLDPRNPSGGPEGLTPLEINAKIKMMCYLEDPEWLRSGAIVEQTPSTIKTTFHDDRLRRKGMYTAGMPHANDAVRHLLLYGRGGGGIREVG